MYGRTSENKILKREGAYAYVYHSAFSRPLQVIRIDNHQNVRLHPCKYKEDTVFKHMYT